jgi:hypothetical protein
MVMVNAAAWLELPAVAVTFAEYCPAGVASDGDGVAGAFDDPQPAKPMVIADAATRMHKAKR